MKAGNERVFKRISFLESPPFTVEAEKLLGFEGIELLQSILSENPNSGDLIQGTGGFRKIRFALPGRGKRGGARVIYFYRDARNVIHLYSVYAKNDKSDLSPEDKKYLRGQSEKIKLEDYP